MTNKKTARRYNLALYEIAAERKSVDTGDGRFPEYQQNNFGLKRAF